MRHRPNLTPTARLILKAVREASTPLSHINIVEVTNASRYTVSSVTQILVKNGLLRRERISGMSYFSLPTPGESATSEVNRG
jgi:hypothetical protein